MDLFLKYFPDLTSRQKDQLAVLSVLYRYWNSRINVISRKDTDNLEIHHILHSLSIAKVFTFRKDTSILDAGTGGGFPGIPLAILFPEAIFTLADSVRKKIRVVEEIKRETGLINVETRAERFENTPGSFDFITGRSVTSLPELCKILLKKVRDHHENLLPNGLIYLKGGEFAEELRLIRAEKKIYDLSQWFEEPFFATKKLVHIYRLYPQSGDSSG